MDVRSRLSENLSSSQEQEVEKTDTSSNDEANEIAEPLEGVPRLRRENAVQVTETCARRKNTMFTPEEDKCLKAGLDRYGFRQWKAILTDCTFHFQKGRTANSLLCRAVRKFGSHSKLSGK